MESVLEKLLLMIVVFEQKDLLVELLIVIKIVMEIVMEKHS